ncbi:acyl-CoA dehydrogenase [Pseudomonas aeruginosa]|nr:acyl-CoA dehydrogenase [Pseudomonas aeruginosa]HBN9723153.1 acyl-CoA dehydrogenase [Pseudomonas aeruginosa]HBN9768366.1 acyl-CoA dehydrogenase [Pseudomonas aeruginosa]HBN9890043.1 acyl-CoA dehydrogenase [Pseudomonas aeruginosa]
MSWQRLLGPLDRLPTEGSLEDWHAAALARADGLGTLERAVLGGRLAASPGLAFLAGYQAALRALWPAAPEGLGALCVTEKRSVRPADLQTRLEGLVLHGQKDFVTAGDSASWWLVAARDEAPGQPPRLSMTVVLAGAPGARLEALPALPLMPDVPHSRLLLDGAHCERLPGDGWDDYVRPFRLLEDVHALAALVGWLYGVGHECGWPSPLLLRLAGILGGCAEVARHPVACVGTQAVLAGLFEQFSALEGQLDAAFAANASTWEALWQRDRGLLAIANGARKVRLEKALTRLGLDPGQ